MNNLIKVLILFLSVCLFTSCEQIIEDEKITINPPIIVSETNLSIDEAIAIEAKVENNISINEEASIHVKKRTMIDFDLYYRTYVGYDKELLDQGYIVYYIGDYFHHNTKNFLNLFWQCKAGMKVKINNIIYTSGGIYHGVIVNNKLVYDDGSPCWHYNSIVELITCDSRSPDDSRWILKLY